MVHTWYEATDKSDTFVRVVVEDYSKAFDHINHEILIEKLCGICLPAHLVRWMAAFLIDRQQCVKICDIKNKIANNVSVMYRVRHLLTNCTLILPYLNYCCEAWGNTYKPLYIIQKKVII